MGFQVYIQNCDRNSGAYDCVQNLIHQSCSRSFLNLLAKAKNATGGGIDYLFLTGSINIPSISKSIFKRLIASLASLISLKGPAITRQQTSFDITLAGIGG